jgi:hypothetical protein
MPAESLNVRPLSRLRLRRLVDSDFRLKTARWARPRLTDRGKGFLGRPAGGMSALPAAWNRHLRITQGGSWARWRVAVWIHPRTLSGGARSPS